MDRSAGSEFLHGHRFYPLLALPLLAVPHRSVNTRNARESAAPLYSSDEEVTVVRPTTKMPAVQPMAPTRRMLAIHDDLLAMARGEEPTLERTYPPEEGDPFVTFFWTRTGQV